MSASNVAPTLRVSSTREIAMPLALLAVVIVSVAVSYARVTAIESTQARQGQEILALQAEARTTREILIRIDENVKELKRLQNKGAVIP